MQAVPVMSRKSIPVREGTRDRLLAYSNRNLLDDQSYDEAVNELLDWLEFPTTDEIYQNYSVIWNVVPRTSETSAMDDDFEPSVRTESVLGRDE
jgi:hypothetical protein